MHVCVCVCVYVCACVSVCVLTGDSSGARPRAPGASTVCVCGWVCVCVCVYVCLTGDSSGARPRVPGAGTPLSGSGTVRTARPSPSQSPHYTTGRSTPPAPATTYNRLRLERIRLVRKEQIFSNRQGR